MIKMNIGVLTLLKKDSKELCESFQSTSVGHWTLFTSLDRIRQLRIAIHQSKRTFVPQWKHATKDKRQSWMISPPEDSLIIVSSAIRKDWFPRMRDAILRRVDHAMHWRTISLPHYLSLRPSNERNLSLRHCRVTEWVSDHLRLT